MSRSSVQKPVVEPQPAFNYGDLDLVEDEHQIHYLRGMEEAIAAHPRAYAVAVKSAGETATEALFLNRIPDIKPVAKREPSSVIAGYLAERYYYGLGFDPGTEQALAQDAGYQAIISTMQSSRNRQSGGNITREKQIAALGIYVGRVAAWSAQQKSTQSEKAG